MFAATTSNAVGSVFSGIPVHPGEDASAKEEDDWWRIFDGVLAATDASFPAPDVCMNLYELSAAP